MKLTELKSEAVNARIMAEAQMEIWLEYEEEAEAIRKKVAQQEVKQGACKVLICLVLLLILGGCNNTFDGFGRFVSGVGEDISQAATRNEARK